jgi:hypothetical protein
MASECVKSKLCACSLGLTFGVLKGLCLLLIAWAGWLFSYSGTMVGHMSVMYHGYASTFVGGLIGGLYGLIGGFISGFIIGCVYNFFLSQCNKYSCKSESK